LNTPRKLAAEAPGTALLLAAVIGSGIMGGRLSDGNVAGYRVPGVMEIVADAVTIVMKL
jgi:hypothetical protein